MEGKFISSIFEFLSFGIILIFVLFFVFIANKARAKKLKELVKEFSGKILYFPFLSLKAKYNGVNFKISLIPASRNTPPYLYIYFYRRATFSLTIRKDSSLTRLGKKFGFIQVIKTHDAEFDREFIVISRNKGTVLSLLSRLEVKQAMRDIFSAGFTVIKAKREFFISKPDYKFEEDLKVQRIRFWLERLFIIARGY